MPKLGKEASPAGTRNRTTSGPGGIHSASDIHSTSDFVSHVYERDEQEGGR